MPIKSITNGEIFVFVSDNLDTTLQAFNNNDKKG